MFLGEMMAYAMKKTDKLEIDGKDIGDDELVFKRAKLYRTLYSLMIGVGTVFAYYIALQLNSSFFGLLLILAVVLTLLAFIFDYLCKLSFRRYLK